MKKTSFLVSVGLVNHSFLIFFARLTMFIVKLDRKLIRKINRFDFSFLKRNTLESQRHKYACAQQMSHTKWTWGGRFIQLKTTKYSILLKTGLLKSHFSLCKLLLGFATTKSRFLKFLELHVLHLYQTMNDHHIRSNTFSKHKKTGTIFDF